MSLPADEFVANRGVADDDAYRLSDEAVKIVRAWYSEDYRFIARLDDLGLTEPPSQVRSALAAVAVS